MGPSSRRRTRAGGRRRERDNQEKQARLKNARAARTGRAHETTSGADTNEPVHGYGYGYGYGSGYGYGYGYGYYSDDKKMEKKSTLKRIFSKS